MVMGAGVGKRIGHSSWEANVREGSFCEIARGKMLRRAARAPIWLLTSGTGCIQQ